MNTTSPQIVWRSQSVSWMPKELKELKTYAKLKGVSLSAYIRTLTRRDRHRRLKLITSVKPVAARKEAK